MSKNEMQDYVVTGRLGKVKNKNIKAVLITHDNVVDLKKDYPFIEMFGQALFVSFMSFMSLPAYLVNINPQQPDDKKKYKFESQFTFERNTEIKLKK